MLNRTKRILILMSGLLFSVATAYGAENTEKDLALAYGDKANISIATGSSQPISRAPSTATVITAEDIKAMGATDLDQALESVPGIHVSRASIRYASNYVIRGIGAGGQTNPQVLLLQNGIPMTTMYTNDKGYTWVGVPLENIARIEIIRGPGSALYGADAYSGVINVITKTAADTPTFEFGTRAGSFNSKNAWVQHGGQWGGVDVAAYLNVGSTDGQKQIISADAQTANDTRYGTHASLAPGSVNTGYDSVDGNLDLAYNKWRVRTAYKLRDKMGTGAGVSSALDPNSLGRAESVNSDVSWIDADFSRNWNVGVTGSAQYYASTQPNNLMLYPAGAQLGTNSFPNGLIGGPNSWDKQFRLSGNATYTGLDSHSLRLGAGHDYLNLYRVRTINNFTLSATGAPIPINGGQATDITDIQPHVRTHLRSVNYLYAQDEWGFARDWTLTAGVRHDRYSDFGNTTNPRLALVWNTSLDLTAKLLFGKAFRAPSFAEQYGTNPVVNGNPNLKPENIQTLETAFAWQVRQDTQLNLSLYHYDMHDVIRLVANTAPALGSTYQNIGNQRGNGMELETVWDASNALRISGNFSTQKSVDAITGLDSGYAPGHHLYLRTDWRYASDWLSSAQINRVMDRKRTSGDNRPQVPDYTTVDLYLNTPTVGAWNFSATLRNLFNADARDPSLAPGLIPNDLPLAPRSLWLQAICKL